MSIGSLATSSWTVFIVSAFIAFRLRKRARQRKPVEGEETTRDKIRNKWLQHFEIIAGSALIFCFLQLWFNHAVKQNNIEPFVQKFEGYVVKYSEWIGHAKIGAWTSVAIILAFMWLGRWSMRAAHGDHPTRAKLVDKGQNFYKFYKRLVGILSFVGVALGSFTFLGTNEYSVVSHVNARLKTSRESYKYLRAIVRADLEYRIKHRLIERGQASMPANLHEISKSNTKLEEAQHKYGFEHAMFELTVKHEPYKLGPSPPDSVETGLSRYKLPSDEVCANKDVRGGERSVGQKVDAALTIAQKDSGVPETTFESPGEPPEPRKPTAQGVELFGAIVEALLGERGSELVEQITGAPPLVIKVATDPQSDITEALFVGIWKKADQIARDQLRHNALDIDPAVNAAAQDFVSNTEFSWNDISKGQAENAVKVLEEEAESARNFADLRHRAEVEEGKRWRERRAEAEKQILELRDKLKQVDARVMGLALTTTMPSNPL